MSGAIYNVTLYDRTTGEIVGHGTHSGNASYATAATHSIDGSFDTATHYVTWSENDLDGVLVCVNPTATVRPSMTIVASSSTVVADGSSAVSITGIPQETTVLIDGETHQITDGEISFTADHAGQYDLVFTLFPFQPFTVSIQATAS